MEVWITAFINVLGAFILGWNFLGILATRSWSDVVPAVQNALLMLVGLVMLMA